MVLSLLSLIFGFISVDLVDKFEVYKMLLPFVGTVA